MDYVAIDIGASNTRYASIGGRINFLPNNMQIVDEKDFNKVFEPQSKEFLDHLDVTIIKDGDNVYAKAGEKKMFPVRVHVGVLAEGMHNINMTPNAMSDKDSQDINYYSIVMATAISKMTEQGIGDKLNVFVAIPPSQCERSNDAFRKALIGNYEVIFTRGKDTTKVNFTINNVATYQESRLAFMQYMFDPRFPDRYSTLMTRKAMSIDIGASTTDICTFTNGRYMENSGYTSKIGCNNVKAILKMLIDKEFRFKPDDRQTEAAYVEGRILIGNTYHDCGKLVEDAKRSVAEKLVLEINQFIQMNDSMQSFNHIVVSGGGSMTSSYVDGDGKVIETARSITDFIFEEMKKYVNAELPVEHFGDEPRLANIRGLGLVAATKQGEIIN